MPGLSGCFIFTYLFIHSVTSLVCKYLPTLTVGQALEKYTFELLQITWNGAYCYFIDDETEAGTCAPWLELQE